MYSHKFSVFDHKWHSFHFVGEWDEWTSGGCMNHESWIKNPQYALEVLDDKSPTTVFIYVSQPDRRLHLQDQYEQSIGCYVHKVKAGATRVMNRSDILAKEKILAKDKNQTIGSMLHENDDSTPTFINKRDVCIRTELTAGHYVIMPCTFEANVQMYFSMGVFAESKVKCKEILSEKMCGITCEFADATAGGPPEVGEIARSEKKHDLNAAFLSNPKVALHYKSSRRIADSFTLTIRVESKGLTAPYGLRVYKKTKRHQTYPLVEKNVIEEFAPVSGDFFSHELHLEKKQGPFCFVPYTEKKGQQGKVSISVTSVQPGLSLEQYY
jgi:hypothetical protein